MVLIGCKTDLRKDKEQLRKLRAAQLEPITYTQVTRGSPHPTPRIPGSHAQPWREASQAFGLCNWCALVTSWELKAAGF